MNRSPGGLAALVFVLVVASGCGSGDGDLVDTKDDLSGPAPAVSPSDQPVAPTVELDPSVRFSIQDGESDPWRSLGDLDADAAAVVVAIPTGRVDTQSVGPEEGPLGVDITEMRVVQVLRGDVPDTFDLASSFYGVAFDGTGKVIEGLSTEVTSSGGRIPTSFVITADREYLLYLVPQVIDGERRPELAVRGLASLFSRARGAAADTPFLSLLVPDEAFATSVSIADASNPGAMTPTSRPTLVDEIEPTRRALNRVCRIESIRLGELHDRLAAIRSNRTVDAATADDLESRLDAVVTELTEALTDVLPGTSLADVVDSGIAGLRDAEHLIGGLATTADPEFDVARIDNLLDGASDVFVSIGAERCTAIGTTPA